MNEVARTALDYSAGMERASRGPRYSQSVTGIPTEVDQGNRASLVRQDLSDRIARYLLSKLAALHGVLLLSRDKPSHANESRYRIPFAPWLRLKGSMAMYSGSTLTATVRPRGVSLVRATESVDPG